MGRSYLQESKNTGELQGFSASRARICIAAPGFEEDDSRSSRQSEVRHDRYGPPWAASAAHAFVQHGPLDRGVARIRCAVRLVEPALGQRAAARAGRVRDDGF